MGLRDFIKTISPPWLADGSAERVMYTIGIVGDALLEKLNEGVRAHIPTYGDADSAAAALAMVGNDRVIGQGVNELPTTYGKRLQRAFDDWSVAGSARSVLRQATSYVGQATRARMVSQSSVWDTYNEFTDTTQPPWHKRAANWNWDSLSTPLPVQGWWRSWLILYAAQFPNQSTLTVSAVTNPSFSVLLATNASPIVVTTTAPHGLATGAQVTISGVVGNTAANGVFTVTVTGASAFSLNGSTGNGAYTVFTGTVLTGPITITTATPHGLSTGQCVVVAGIIGNSAANGQWAITVPSTTTFTLNYCPMFGVPLAAYISGGTVATTWNAPASSWGTGGMKWGTDPTISWGMAVPPGTMKGITAIVGQWKNAGSVVPWVITTFSTTWYDPTSTGSFLPDGTWGYWAKVVNNVYVAARDSSSRYSDGAN